MAGKKWFGSFWKKKGKGGKGKIPEFKPDFKFEEIKSVPEEKLKAANRSLDNVMRAIVSLNLLPAKKAQLIEPLAAKKRAIILELMKKFVEREVKADLDEIVFVEDTFTEDSISGKKILSVPAGNMTRREFFSKLAEANFKLEMQQIYQ